MKGLWKRSPPNAGSDQWIRCSARFAKKQAKLPAPLAGNARADFAITSATERDGVEIWHPYALLHYLKKPVDSLTLDADERVITVPVESALSPSALRGGFGRGSKPDPSLADYGRELWEEVKG